MPRRPFHLTALLITGALAGAVAIPPAAAGDLTSSPRDAVRQDPDAVPPAPLVYGPGGYGVVPRAPTAPFAAIRPPSWPGGPASSAAEPPAVQAAAGATLEACHQAQMVARVASEAILVSDLLAALDNMLAGRKEELDRGSEKIPPEQWEAQRKNLTNELIAAIDDAIAGAANRGAAGESPEDQAKAERRSMLKQLLKQQIEGKLVYEDAKRKIPAENFPNVEKQLKKQFDEVEINKLLKQAGVDSWRELDQYYRQRGSSLDREKQRFLQRVLVQQWLWQQIKPDEEVTYDQMVNYYHQHPSEFDTPTRTRWQELMVPFVQFPSKREAQATMESMGNAVLRGADFAKVAQSAGSDSTSDGTIHEWPDKSRMVSPLVAQAIEGLPAGQMSQILEDWRGLHIIRVVERVPAGRRPFEAVQAEIREKVRKRHSEEQMQTYLARLKEQTPIWTILDDAATGPRAQR